MGEKTEFRAGDKAPNTGTYMEIGENDRIMGIQNPQTIQLEAGEEFPEPSNHNRKWTRKHRNSEN
ncbi:YjzC family protein [Gorillibacterium sp. sgz500922]|uniref:YjzC family protein n=1 Tax=Gorillibacterium sp. sgz500922 TaxID=3446694 RepID=UPI003F675FFB